MRLKKPLVTIDGFETKSIIFNGAKVMANIQVLKTQWEYGVRQFSEDLISVELASCRLDKRRIIWHLTLVYFDHVGINFKLVHAFLGWTMPQVTTSSYHWVTPASHLASQSVKLACELASQSVSQSVSRSVGQSVALPSANKDRIKESSGLVSFSQRLACCKF